MKYFVNIRLSFFVKKRILFQRLASYYGNMYIYVCGFRLAKIISNFQILKALNTLFIELLWKWISRQYFPYKTTSVHQIWNQLEQNWRRQQNRKDLFNILELAKILLKSYFIILQIRRKIG